MTPARVCTCKCHVASLTVNTEGLLLLAGQGPRRSSQTLSKTMQGTLSLKVKAHSFSRQLTVTSKTKFFFFFGQFSQGL